MECKIINQTPLPAILEPYSDLAGFPYILIITKASWRLDSGRLASAEQQAELRTQPQRILLGELDIDENQRRALGDRQHEEIIWLDHDLSPPKPAFDILVAGYATAPPDYKKQSLKASIRIGRHESVIEAYVPRYWKMGWFGHSAQAISPAVKRVPLSYAVADWSSGFPVATPDTPQRLPWLQALGAGCQRTKHAKHPSGFGFWPENSPHRQPYSGTYDEAWQRNRMPKLPKDFDARFYNTAHPELQFAKPPSPGTRITLENLSTQPLLDISMPHLALAVEATTANGSLRQIVTLQPDTLIIEPEHSRMSLVLRALLRTADGAEALRSIRLFKADS